ncbi:MAG: ABC transporter ATP-binding protein [Sulfolobales archaeon]
MQEIVLRVEGITKRFGNIIANDGVSLELYRSEVHGLLGENGSGKSTLCKIIYGQLRPDAGRIYVYGREVRFRSPRDAIRLGIAMVHQELSLIPTLTVSENLVLARGKGVGAPRRKVYEEVRDIGERFGIEIPPDVPIYKLSYGERQRIEILKALSLGARILIMDEPTTYLTKVETEKLFQSLRRMVSEGISILFVSHRIEEILSITDRVTVLRAGRVVGRGVTKELSREELVKMIIGDRAVGSTAKEAPQQDLERRLALSVRGLEVRGDLGQVSVRGVDLDLYYGEILGIAGVEGNGQKELFEAIAGIRRPINGIIRIDDIELKAYSPKIARRLGISYVPEDPGLALVADYPAFRNIVISPQISRRYIKQRIFLDVGRVKEVFRSLVRRYSIKVERPEQRTSTLSGGTKQKVVLARELHVEPRILLLYNPTKGLDIATTEHLKEIVLEEKRRGKAILYYSADLNEILELSDRIAIIYGGKIVATLDRSEADLYRIAYAMTTGRDPGPRSQNMV